MHGPLAFMHVTAALTALLSGFLVVQWPKGRTAHRLTGLVYVFAMLMTNTSALMIYHLTGHFGLFHVFALLSLFYTVMGLAMPILRRGDWLYAHVRWMTWSYLSLLAAALNELAIRLPLHIDTPPRILAVGAGLGVTVLACAIALRPRLKRVALQMRMRPS